MDRLGSFIFQGIAVLALAIGISAAIAVARHPSRFQAYQDVASDAAAGGAQCILDPLRSTS
ncbi:hypothetical protein BH10PSE17_BH10PSE17_01630 [soil metagenome]